MSRGAVATAKTDSGASGFLFGLFVFFTIDFFLHFSARIPGYGALRPTLVLTLVIAIMLFLQKDRLKGYGDAPVFKAIILLIIFVFVSLPLVTWPGSVLRENIPEFVKAASFFFFAALIIDTEKRLKIFLFVFIGCQLIRVLEPLYLNVTTGYHGAATYMGKGEYSLRLGGAPSDVINPNGLGFVIATVIPYLYYLVWCSRIKLAKLFFLCVAPMLIYALVLTQSRGGFIALLVVLWMIFKDSRHKAVMIIALVLAGSFMWANMTSIQKERYLSLISTDTRHSSSASGRISGMWEELSIGLRKPLFGHGVGTTPEAKFHAVGRDQAAHNLYAEMIIEIGLIGFFIFMRYFREIYRSFRRNLDFIKSAAAEHRTEFPYRLNQALVTVFWMYIVYSLNYWGLSVYYWYLFGGLTVAFSRIYFKEQSQEVTESRVAVPRQI